MEQKTESDEINQLLDVNRIQQFYHFTDRSNINSILRNGGLISWKDCEKQGITIHCPGGESLSRSLDSYSGLEDYVRVSFVKDLPMLYVAKKEGRISDSVILRIDRAVATWKGTLYSDQNATRNVANVGSKLSNLENIQFNVFRQSYFDLEDDEKHYYSAEVLVHQRIPTEYILNLPCISSLTANHKLVIIGDSVTITWDVKHATRITLNGHEQNGNGQIKERITNNRQNYELTAYNEETDTSTNQSIEIVAIEQPTFTVDRDTLTKEKKEQAKLSWNVDNAITVTLITVGGRSQEVSANNSMKVSPETTTTYILKYRIGTTSEHIDGEKRIIINVYDTFDIVEEELKTLKNEMTLLEQNMKSMKDGITLLGQNMKTIEENDKTQKEKIIKDIKINRITNFITIIILVILIVIAIDVIITVGDATFICR
jgi:hypothetical protein